MWIMIGALFVLLAVSRVLDLETVGEAWLRGILQRDQAYTSRREFQAPLAALLVMIAFAVSAGAIALRTRANARFGRPLARAIAAALAMLVLVAVRVVSFHGTDALLYAGPIHLNWLLDIALTAVVGASAYVAIRRPLQRTRHRR